MRGVYMYVNGSLVCIRAVARREWKNGLGLRVVQSQWLLHVCSTEEPMSHRSPLASATENYEILCISCWFCPVCTCIVGHMEDVPESHRLHVHIATSTFLLCDYIVHAQF